MFKKNTPDFTVNAAAPIAAPLDAKKPELAVFNFGGTLTKNNKVLWSLKKELTRELEYRGFRLTRGESEGKSLEHFVKKHHKDKLLSLQPSALVEAEKIIDEVFTDEKIDKLVQGIGRSGALTMLKHLQEEGVKIAIVDEQPDVLLQKVMKRIIENTGLTDNIIIAGEDEKHNYSQVFDSVLDQAAMKDKLDSVYFVGDSLHDVSVAQKAKVNTVLMSGDEEINQERFGNKHKVLDQMMEGPVYKDVSPVTSAEDFAQLSEFFNHLLAKETVVEKTAEAAAVTETVKLKASAVDMGGMAHA